MLLKGKKILIGISAGIAAYKAAILVRELSKLGAEIQVIMTKDATSFVTPLTLATLSKKPVLIDFFKNETGEWNNHVELGLWADLMLIVPATANTLSKMANGQCDNLLIATYLSARCPVLFAPAMDLDMFAHPTTKENIAKLVSFGNKLIPPGIGELASGLHGEGRLAEVETILKSIVNHFNPKLNKTRVLISAGPTYEKIDSVRYIGNFSSGKMGFALANAFAELGAKVDLVAGPTQLTSKHPNIIQHNVVSADEMYHKCISIAPKTNYIIMSAAVADFKPALTSDKKIKKKGAESLTIELTQNKDILAELGKLKTSKQILVGFALEDHDEIKHASEKIKKKNLDFIVLNSLNDKGAGFGFDTNKVTIIDKKSTIKELPLASKNEIAIQIVDWITK